MRRLALLLLLAAASAAGHALPAGAQEATIGGGSDIRHGAVVSLPAGTSIAPVHHIFADNPGGEPIEVEFRSQSDAGIEVLPERTRFTVPPGAAVKDAFGIRASEAVPPGDHRVTVQLVRADVRAEPGVVTNIPAIEVSFVLRVVGDTATVNVRSIGAESGRAVDGTLIVTATDQVPPFEVARAEGAELTATVAPGTYEAAYRLGGRELARAQVEVAAGDTADVALEVDTVSFVVVDAAPVTEGRTVVLADLVAAVDNHLQPVDGGVRIEARVYRDDELVEEVTITERDDLPLGITEARLAYRPEQGFAPGRYRFQFRLVTEAFEATATDEPGFAAARSLLFPLAGGLAFAVLVSAAGLLALRSRPRPPARPRPRPRRATHARRSSTPRTTSWSIDPRRASSGTG